MTDPVRHRRLISGLRRKYAAGPSVVVVDVAGTIEDAMPSVVAAIADATISKVPTLVLAIDSPGGLIDESLAVANAIMAFKGHTVGVVVGACDSAATTVLAACRERHAPVTAQFLVHASWTAPTGRGEMTLALIESKRAVFKNYDARVRAFMSERCGKDFAKFYNGADHILSAHQAHAAGLLTETPAWEASLSSRRSTILSEAATLAALKQNQIDLRARVVRAVRS